MFTVILLQIPTVVTDATKPIIDYGVIGGILVLAIAGLVFLYRSMTQRMDARYDDMSAINKSERERWQLADTQRFQAITDVAKNETEALMKNVEALSTLSSLIRERIAKP
jgi:hypothetical protein